MANIFTQIAANVVKDFDAAEKVIDADAAKVIQAVPALAQETADLVSDVKQGASDLLGAAGTFLGQGGAALTTGIESAADAALTKLGAGVLDPIANSAINMIVTLGVSSLQAWALATKAKLSAVPAAIPPSPPAEG